MSKILDNLKTYRESVDMPGGYTHDLSETIKGIDLYYNSKFKNGQWMGKKKKQRKFFYNIVKPACDVATKFVDLDTKDVLLIPTSVGDEMKVWLMQKDLHQFMKDSDFATLLNQIGQDYPKYGHVVIKKAQKKWSKTNLENLRMDPSAQSLEKSSFVYEAIVMTPSEVKAMPWDQDVVDTLLERTKGEKSILIYDCYVPSGKKWDHEILGDPLAFQRTGGGTLRTAESQLNKKGHEQLPDLVLKKDTVDKLPYRELKWEEVPGRWLGMGFVEYLEDNQIAINEAENLERMGLKYTSLHLWQTRDETVGGRNVLTDVENGDILTIDAEVTPVAMEERNLPAYNATRDRWNVNTEKKTFSFDIATGDNLPSRTPLGVANLQASVVASYFELKQENFGIFIKKLVQDDILPDFKNKSKKEHMLTFLGSDEELDKLDKAITRTMTDNAVIEHAKRTGFFPSVKQRKRAEGKVREQLNERSNRYLKIPDSFYTNSKYYIDIIITGEQMDTGTRARTIETALGILGTNPGILQNRTTRNLLFKLIGLGGISPVELGLLTDDVDTTPVQQGGSVAKPGATGAQRVSSSQQL